jgi:6-pyruvoyltetrahydropterin/6-carboxytetrahydropterin synthase
LASQDRKVARVGWNCSIGKAFRRPTEPSTPPWIDSAALLDDKTLMFTIAVESSFHASHHIRFADGTMESPHAHDWFVRIFVRRPRLDSAGMVADFDRVRETLSEALSALDRADLNTHPTLHGLNPTAEIVAKRIFDRLIELGLSDLHRVEVTEAPGCVAIFETGI